MKNKYKNLLIQTVVLLVVFVAAVNIFGYIVNRGKDNRMADMGAATYPQLSFSYSGYTINKIPGYKKEMEIVSLRDTITPVTNGQVDLTMKAYDTEINSVLCEVYPLDGSEVLQKEEIKNPGKDVVITFPDASAFSIERVLKFSVNLADGRTIYYYTRAVDSGDKYLVECLNYIKDYHENALAKAEGAGVGKALETDSTADHATLQHVTIKSEYDQVTWGNLAPTVEGGETWMIKELNSTSTSVQLQYQVRCKGEENEEDLYKVKEFFRVRYQATSKEGLLLAYDRTMDQMFDTTKTILGESSVILGIADTDVDYVTSSDGKKTAFVQADELWHYNKEKDRMSLVFSFSSAGNTDERNRTDQYMIKPLSMDKAGNMIFAVYGYMNRGDHEGEVGVAVYDYHAADNTVEERAFLATKKSYGHAIESYGKLLYYNEKSGLMYVLADGTLYEIDVEKNKAEALVEDLQDEQYVVSQDHKYLAYQIVTKTEDSLDTKICVKNLVSGKERTVESEAGETIRPLGFVDHDFVYGAARDSDAGEDISGEAVAPMYKLEIQSSKGRSIKTYEENGIYILSAVFEDKMITLNRVTKKGNVYKTAIEDHITNNEEKEESNISVSVYATQLKKRQVKIAFADGIDDRNPQILRAKQLMVENVAEFNFDHSGQEDAERQQYYIYGLGELKGIYKTAGAAIQAADACSGVVVSSRQMYVWERGNRDLQYRIDSEAEVLANLQKKLKNGMTPIEAVQSQNNGTYLDLKGCSVEQLMYIINHDHPIVAMKDAKSAFLLVGYTETTVSYMDIETGERKNIPVKDVENMTKKSGHTYIG